MKRKDTILVAVLINAALLTALFITAIKRDEQKTLVSTAAVDTIQHIELPKQSSKKEIKEARGDEIDQVLKDFSIKKTEASSQKIDFAKELEAINKIAVEKPKEMHKDSVIEIVVQKGDVLARIAQDHGTSVESIMQQNKLKNSTLQIGQILKIIKNKTAQIPSENEQYYIVKPRDNPWSIAAKNQMKVDQLLQLNNLDDEKARRLKPGDKLRIR